MRTGLRTRGIRYRPDVGFEARCDDCRARHDGSGWYWPITLEYWRPESFARCRTCQLLKDRAKQRELRQALSPEQRRAKDRARYWANRRVILIKRREYAERNHDAILARRRASYAKGKAAA